MEEEGKGHAKISPLQRCVSRWLASSGMANKKTQKELKEKQSDYEMPNTQLQSREKLGGGHSPYGAQHDPAAKEMPGMW